MRYEHIVFDIDGTLMDSTGAIREGLDLMAVEVLGHSLTPELRERCLGLPAREGLESLGLPGDDEHVGLWLSKMGECWDQVHLFDGIEWLIDELARDGHVLGAVTSETRSEMELGFSGFGLVPKLGTIVVADDTKLHKPNPDPLLHYLASTGARADSTLYVGDSHADALCAHAAGVDFVQVCWRTDPDTTPAPAKAVFRTPQQLLNWIRTQESGPLNPLVAAARELQAIAQTGLWYSKDRFDLERFERVREVSCELMGQLSGEPANVVHDLFANERGYQTPKLCTRAVVFDGEGRLCLVRDIDGRWALPGGWCDVGLTIYQNVVKEAREEAGLAVVPERLIAIQEHNLHNDVHVAWGILKHFVECRNLGGDFALNNETTERGFFSANELPELCTSKNTSEQIAMCFAAHEAGDAWRAVID